MRRQGRNPTVARVSPDVLDEELFRGVLIRERKRSDRSNQRFVLFLVYLNEIATAPRSPVWDAVIDAVAVAKRETDVVGWFESWAAIGVILPGIRGVDSADPCERFDARFRRSLAERLSEEALGKISIGRHVYPEPKGTGQDLPWPVDPMLYPELRARRPRGWMSFAVKRGVDVIGSLTLLGVLAPLLVLICTLVKLRSRGPIFFRQVRVGQMMKPFTMLKFRTMYSDADHRIHHEFVSSFIKASGQVRETGKNGFFKLVDDPRVTSVGRLLRSTSLDELPQLWNVLRGDMSLVGPRPPLPYELEQYEPWHRCRILEAKPGLTGLWQVIGRSRTTFDEMVRLDLRYARTRSLRTDIKILLATPAAVISGKGAC